MCISSHLVSFVCACSSLQPRRQRSSNDDAGGRGSHTSVLPHYSNSMRVRKTTAGIGSDSNNNGTSLPVPQHTRAASTPSKIENVSGSSIGFGSKSDAIENDLRSIKPLEKKYQSTLDTTSIGRSDDLIASLKSSSTLSKGGVASSPATPSATASTGKSKTSLLQREQKRAASESPTKTTHSKRSQSMSSGDKPSTHMQHVHQQKRSLDVTSSGAAVTKQHKSGSSGAGAAATGSGNILPTQELLAQLLKGSSEKLLSEQRQQMFAVSLLRLHL